MLKVLITTVPFGKYNAFILDEMKSAGLEFVVNPLARRLKEDELADMISDFDILIAGTEPITARVMSRASNLKLISRVGIGLDNVDLNAAKRNRILVSYTPNAPTEAVAELTIGSIFSLLRDTLIANLQMHKRIWERRFGRRLGDVSIGIDFNAVQRRHNGAMECNDGYYMQRLYANGTVQCEKDAVNLMNLGNGLLQRILHLPVI